MRTMPLPCLRINLQPMWPWPLTFYISALMIQWTFTVTGACHVWLKFVGQFLRHDAKRNFCDLFRPHLTLTFDLLTPKLTVSCRCYVDHLCQFTSTLAHLFSKFVLTSLVTDGRMDGQSRTLWVVHQIPISHLLLALLAWLSLTSTHNRLTAWDQKAEGNMQAVPPHSRPRPTPHCSVLGKCNGTFPEPL